MWGDYFSQDLLNPAAQYSNLITLSEMLSLQNMNFQLQNQQLYMQPGYFNAPLSPFQPIFDQQFYESFNNVFQQQIRSPEIIQEGLRNQRMIDVSSQNQDSILPSTENFPLRNHPVNTELTIIQAENDERLLLDEESSYSNEQLTKDELKALPTKVYAKKRIMKQKLKRRRRNPNYDLKSLSDSSSDCQCSICLCPYRSKEKITTLYCNHNFHKKCIVRWLTKVSKCPLCKSNQKRRRTSN